MLGPIEQQYLRPKHANIATGTAQFLPEVELCPLLLVESEECLLQCMHAWVVVTAVKLQLDADCLSSNAVCMLRDTMHLWDTTSRGGIS